MGRDKFGHDSYFGFPGITTFPVGMAVPEVSEEKCACACACVCARVYATYTYPHTHTHTVCEYSPVLTFKEMWTLALQFFWTHFCCISVGLETVVYIRRRRRSLTEAETESACVLPEKLLPTASWSSVATACARGMGYTESFELSPNACNFNMYFACHVHRTERRGRVIFVTRHR